MPGVGALAIETDSTHIALLAARLPVGAAGQWKGLLEIPHSRRVVAAHTVRLDHPHHVLLHLRPVVVQGRGRSLNIHTERDTCIQIMYVTYGASGAG